MSGVEEFLVVHGAKRSAPGCKTKAAESGQKGMRTGAGPERSAGSAMVGQPLWSDCDAGAIHERTISQVCSGQVYWLGLGRR